MASKRQLRYHAKAEAKANSSPRDKHAPDPEQLILPKFARVRGALVPATWLACLEPHPKLPRVKCQRAIRHEGSHIKSRTGTAEPEHEWTTPTI